MSKTTQEEKWTGEFGDEYVLRNPLNIEDMEQLYTDNYGITRSDLNKEFLENIPRSIKILEVGPNVGVQLALLQKLGFEHLYGLEINRAAIESAKQYVKSVDIIQGTVFDIPFKDHYFDLVFTSGVLIHISPQDIQRAMKEIYRCTDTYIWGFEYYAPEYTEILYRENTNLLWKADFPRLYLKFFEDLQLVKERQVQYLKDENKDIMFLLKKNEKKS